MALLHAAASFNDERVSTQPLTPSAKQTEGRMGGRGGEGPMSRQPAGAGVLLLALAAAAGSSILLRLLVTRGRGINGRNRQQPLEGGGRLDEEGSWIERLLGGGGSQQRRRRRRRAAGGYAALIGDTPLVELRSLSRATGCRIFAKAEYLNPGGTSKDRVALQIIEEAERSGQLRPGGTVVEGTSGSTGIALAALCRARGYRCLIVMPDDQAAEKVRLLRQFGAEVEVVKPAGIANPSHYCNRARARAEEAAGGVFMDQFETAANFRAHYEGTGPEMWAQLQEDWGLRPDAFVMSAGTGGCLAGVSRCWKERHVGVRVFLVDPPGSALYNKVKHGVCYAVQQQERSVRRHRYDSIAEGIGLDRVTANFAAASVDDAFAVSDQEALHMAHFLLHHEGLFVGSSTAMNAVGAVLAARQLGPGNTVVTVLCDGGHRHLTRFWSPAFVAGVEGLVWPSAPPEDLSFVRPR